MKTPFVALQLYTVRDYAAQNTEDALQKVKEMGYDYVELAGTYNMKPAELKKILDKVGLTAISAHVQFGELKADLEGTAAAYKALGCEHIVIPMLPAECFPGGSDYEETRVFLDKFCAACKAVDTVPGYHNHLFEFERLSGDIFKLDKFFDDNPGIFAQLDTGWIKAAGQHPEEYIAKYAGRCPMVHIKDTVVNSYNGYIDQPVGKGSQNVPAIIEASLAAGVSGLIVELDKAVGQTSLEAASESREYLKSLGY